jgi:precorrin-6A/cobalt-precorrin-6A reductase
LTLLILGGTSEARALAAALVDRVPADAAVERPPPVISSLAGRVSRPLLPAGPVRIGGFGGVDGLIRYLRQQRITRVVDATHPFAAQISASAAAATSAAGVPLLRLLRPGWGTRSGASSWTWVADVPAAARAVDPYERPFLTSGRSTLPAFTGLADRDVLIRLVEPPAVPLPRRWRLVLSRGPYALVGERALLREHRSDVLVTKDSGGPHTVAKLDAAAELGVPVVIIARPPPAPGVPVVTDIATALAWCG